MDTFLSSTWGISAFLLGFGFIIFVHELGHFAVAKWVGIKVEQFSVGMGHAVFAWRKGIGFRLKSTIPEYSKRVHAYLKDNPPAGHRDDEVHTRTLEDETSMMHTHEQEQSPYTTEQIDDATEKLGLGETEYKIGWIPLGGYVKMLGQDDLDPEHRSQDPRSYNNKPISARMAVISAGVIMNLIFAMIFFVFAFMMGVELPPAEVGEAVKDMPASSVYAVGHENDDRYKGLKPGDIVTHVDGDYALDFSDIMQAAALSATDNSVELTIQREGEDKPLTYILNPVRGEDQPFAMFGIAPPSTLILPVYASEQGTPEEFLEAGIGSGWRVESVNGQPVANPWEFDAAIEKTGGSKVRITFKNPDSEETKDLLHQPFPVLAESDGDTALSFLGFAPATRIEELVEGGPADKAGAKPDDLIAALGTHRWPSYFELSDIIKSQGDQPFNMKVWRDGKLIDLGMLRTEKSRIGIHLTPPKDRFVLATPAKDTIAHSFNLPGGSTLDSVNGQEIDSFNSFLAAFAKARGDGIVLGLTPNIADAKQQIETLPRDEAAAQAVANIQWRAAIGFKSKKVLVQTNSPIAALNMGVIKTRQTIVNVYMTLARIIDGGVSAKEMRGPLGIGHASIVIVNEMGMTFFIMFLGIISVNLAVINFLPIPVVDGGHMIFLLMEKIKGSPVSVQLQMGATYVGGVLILMVFVFTFYNDVMRLISG